MSLQALAWAIGHQDLPRDERSRRIQSSCKLVLLALANYAGPDGGDCFPSIETIVDHTGLSERAVQYALRSMVEYGTIVETPDPLVRESTIRSYRQRPKSYDLVAFQEFQRGARSTSGVQSHDTRGANSKIDSPDQGCKVSGDLAPEPVIEPSNPKSNLKPSSKIDAAASQATTDAVAEERSRVEPEPREDVERLCAALRDHMIANDCRPPTITQGWRDSARLMLDKDDRQIDEALDLLAWVAHDEFWRANILSLPKFRAKYDQLRLRWQQTNPVRHLRSEEAITHWLRQQWREGMSRLVCDRSGLRYEPPTVLPAEVRSSAQANEWHEKQVRKWIEENHSEIVRRIQERETPIGAAS